MLSEDEIQAEPHLDFQPINLEQKRQSDLYYSLMMITLKSTVLFTLILIYTILVVPYDLLFYHVGLLFTAGCLTGYVFSVLWIRLTLYVPIAKVMLFILTTSALTLPNATFLLLMMRFDGSSRLPYVLIFMPLMIAQAASLLFICFIIPALIEDDQESGQQIRWPAVLLTYYASFWLSEFALMALDSVELQGKLLWVLSPILFAMLMHVIATLFDLRQHYENAQHQGPPSYPPQPTSNAKNIWCIVQLLTYMYTIISVGLLLDRETEEGHLLTASLAFAPIGLVLLGSIVTSIVNS